MLGPLLFLLFVNDLPDLIKTNILMFADDTKIWTRISGVNDSVNDTAGFGFTKSMV